MVDAPGSPALAPPRWPRRRFLVLMVGSPGAPALAPLRGAPSTFLNVDGGRSWISSSGTSQGARHRRFLALMVDALGALALAPPRGPVIDVS
jgi:hypothetical protein